MLRILHADINSYFATLLQQENPALRGKPLGVVKSPGRTCLIATSKEAKKYGIKTGCNVYEARQKYPAIKIVSAEFDKYLDCTKRLKALFNELCPDVHIFSLDEAFLDLSNCQNVYPDVKAFGQLVKQRIKQELGEWVTCNVGISYTKLLAKIASEIGPPDSLMEITPENTDATLAKVTFGDVCGVGNRLEKKLARLNVYHPYAIRFISDEDLLAMFGPFWAPELRRISYGQDSHILSLLDIKKNDDMKSVGRTHTGYAMCDDEQQLKQVLYNLSQEVVYKVRKMKMVGREVGVALWGEDQSWYAHCKVGRWICHAPEFFELIYTQLYQSWQRDFKVIKFGVFLSDLRRQEHVTTTWLPEWHRQEKIATAIDSLTERYGLFTIKPATLLGHDIIRPEVTGYLGDKKYQLELT
ncbi:MAG: hypothetical protein M3Q81_00470 [bacterium]|nr:hypothetical protein [bacterium]